MSDDPSDPSSDPNSPLYISPAFGRKGVSYYQKSKINSSILGDEAPDSPSFSNGQSATLSPEDRELVSSQSQASEERFIKHPSQYSTNVIYAPLSYDDAKALFIAERNGVRGRPSMLTPDRVKIITDEIRLGVPMEVAACMAGLAEGSVEGWINQGTKDIRENKDTDYARFTYEVFIAKRELEARLAKKWVKIVTEPTTKRKTVYKEKVLEKDGKAEVLRYLDYDSQEMVGDGDWKGIESFLERRERERWRKVERVEQTGPDGGPIQVQQATIDVTKLSAEERKVLFGIVKREVEREGGVEEKQVEGSGVEESVSRETLPEGEG